MKKRVISTIIAMTAIVSMTGLSANAKTAQEVMKEQQQKGWYLDYEEIEACSWHGWLGWHSPYDASYLRQYENSSISIMEIQRDPDYMFFAVSNKIDKTDLVLLEEQIKEIDSSLWIYEGGVDNHANPVYGIRSENVDIETKTVKKLYELLKDDIIGFDFTREEYQERHVEYTYLTAYEPFMNEDKCNTQVLEKFISENEINAQVVTYKGGDKDINGNDVWHNDMIYVIPDDEISVTEHLELAKKIYESTGLVPCGTSPEVVHILTTTYIDVYNAIDGDTNNDGELTVADAAAILQYLGNAEEYPISAQGKFNADIEGDGITASDALAVQKMILQSGNK